MKKLNYDKKILVKLSEKQRDRLKEYATRNNKSVSEVVRTSVNRTIVNNNKKQ